jgi:hypothetical protein
MASEDVLLAQGFRDVYAATCRHTPVSEKELQEFWDQHLADSPIDFMGRFKNVVRDVVGKELVELHRKLKNNSEQERQLLLVFPRVQKIWAAFDGDDKPPLASNVEGEGWVLSRGRLPATEEETIEEVLNTRIERANLFVHLNIAAQKVKYMYSRIRREAPEQQSVIERLFKRYEPIIRFADGVLEASTEQEASKDPEKLKKTLEKYHQGSQLLSQKEVAGFFGKDPRTVRRWQREGSLEGVLNPDGTKTIGYTSEQIRQFISRRSIPPKSAKTTK